MWMLNLKICLNDLMVCLGENISVESLFSKITAEDKMLPKCHQTGGIDICIVFRADY